MEGDRPAETDSSMLSSLCLNCAVLEPIVETGDVRSRRREDPVAWPAVVRLTRFAGRWKTSPPLSATVSLTSDFSDGTGSALFVVSFSSCSGATRGSTRREAGASAVGKVWTSLKPLAGMDGAGGASEVGENWMMPSAPLPRRPSQLSRML